MNRTLDEVGTITQTQLATTSLVGTSTREMDKAVQANAATAEETASVSEELNAQAHTLQDYVDQLAALIGGKKTKEAEEKPDTTRQIEA